MGWAKFDDQFSDHPKVQAAGPMAELLAMRAVIYCARYETDGQIRESVLPRLTVGIPSVKRQVSTLIREGLWEKTDDGWLVHDFLDYHPSRADKDAERQAARERMRNVRANKARTESEVQDELDRSSRYPVPDPTREVEESSSSFADFNAGRAVDEVRKRKQRGEAIRSESGYAKTLVHDDEFRAESLRIWTHRDCGSCEGSGFEQKYAPGTGGYQVECTAAVPGGEE